MSTLQVRVIPRLFHFRQPAGTSRGVYLTRKVWYVIITSPDHPHALGIGECAPLPDLSCDALPDEAYTALLQDFATQLQHHGQLPYEALRPYPSMLFGLETAWLSWEASLRGDYLKLFDNPFTAGQEGIPINGLVWMGSYEEMCQRMEEKLALGFHCIKIKIGAIDFEKEVALLRQLRQRYTRKDVELRVDANGGFTPEEALEKLTILAQFDIHSIEQPIRAGQWEDMARLCRTSPLPIALDEELIGVNDLEQKRALLDTIRPQYIILKPTLHGGLRGAEEWMREATLRQIPFWTTSALETNVGLNAIAQWHAQIHHFGIPAHHPTLGLADHAALEVFSEGAERMPLNLPECVRYQGLGTGLLFTDNFQETNLQIEGEQLWYGLPKDREFNAQRLQFEAEWLSEDPTLEVHTSGSTGLPQAMRVEKRRMAASARRTCAALHLPKGASALLCMPLQYIAGKMQLVRALLHPLSVVTIAPCAHPLAKLHQAPYFAAMTPMQVYSSLATERERLLLRQIRCLIIGGGAIPPELEEVLRTFPHAVYSTYGMTETLSHIALRRINGPEATAHYVPFDDVKLSINEAGCLCIQAPEIVEGTLVTNDLATCYPDGSFTILGRRDNTICSGGLKLQIETIEKALAPLPFPFQVTAVPDPKYGEAVTLLYVANEEPLAVAAACRQWVQGPQCPKHFFAVDQLPTTGTGKPARAEARKIAAGFLKKLA